MDAWVGGYVPGVGVAIQLTLPPQPFRAAWWQSTLFIHVAWVRRVRNVKQGADYECDFCRPFRFTYTGCPSRSAPPALVVWGLAGAFRLFRRALGAKWGWMLGWVVGSGGLRMKYNFRVIYRSLGLQYDTHPARIPCWLIPA